MLVFLGESFQLLPLSICSSFLFKFLIFLSDFCFSPKLISSFSLLLLTLSRLYTSTGKNRRERRKRRKKRKGKKEEACALSFVLLLFDWWPYLDTLSYFHLLFLFYSIFFVFLSFFFKVKVLLLLFILFSSHWLLQTKSLHPYPYRLFPRNSGNLILILSFLVHIYILSNLTSLNPN